MEKHTRIEPGDFWVKDGKRLHYTRIIRSISGDEVLYQDIFGQVCATTLRAFSKWAKTAHLVTRKGAEL